MIRYSLHCAVLVIHDTLLITLCSSCDAAHAVHNTMCNYYDVEQHGNFTCYLSETFRSRSLYVLTVCNIKIMFTNIVIHISSCSIPRSTELFYCVNSQALNSARFCSFPWREHYSWLLLFVLCTF